MIELTYINEDVSETKYFETWKSLSEFVMSKKINRYKVKGQSAGGNMIRYTSVLWDDYMVKAFKRLTGEKKV